MHPVLVDMMPLALEMLHWQHNRFNPIMTGFLGTWLKDPWNNELIPVPGKVCVACETIEQTAFVYASGPE